MDTIRNNFPWDEDIDKKKYHVFNCQTVCMHKDPGGLRVLDLEIMNVPLLAKCLWKLFKTISPWQHVLVRKYLQNQTLFQVLPFN
jgi:hypothetical protein